MVCSAQHEQSVEVKHEQQPEAENVSIVESMLLYGCEAWALTVKDEKALDGGVHQNAESCPQHLLGG